MVTQFTCPICKTTFSASRDRTETKANCPVCKTRCPPRFLQTGGSDRGEEDISSAVEVTDAVDAVFSAVEVSDPRPHITTGGQHATNLKPCPDCGHAISQRATTCPSCGAPQDSQSACLDCDQNFSTKMATCPNCGAPREAEQPSSLPTHPEKADLEHPVSITCPKCGSPAYKKDEESSRELNISRYDVVRICDRCGFKYVAPTPPLYAGFIIGFGLVCISIFVLLLCAGFVALGQSKTAESPVKTVLSVFGMALASLVFGLFLLKAGWTRLRKWMEYKKRTVVARYPSDIGPEDGG